MDQYRAFLVQAEEELLSSWLYWVQSSTYQFIRMALVCTARCVFIARDLAVAALNITYMLILAPMDLFLCAVYLIAVNVSPAATSGYEETEEVNLNTIRRMFWQGKQVAVASDLNSLTIPDAVLLRQDEMVLDNPVKNKKWTDPPVQPQMVYSKPVADAEDPDAVVLDQSQQYQVKQTNNHPKKPSLRNRLAEHRQLLYFLTRPGDFKALENYVKVKRRV